MRRGPVRQPKDRDFVETREGFFFCLVGYLHPPGRYTAYLKYAPAATGRWLRGQVFYRRELPYYHVRNVLDTVDALEREHPEYVWTDPAQGLRFSFVPERAVIRYYRPEARLAEIARGAADQLEEAVGRLVGLLTAGAGVRPEAFGVTGSILLGLHNPAFSDIDLIVYGREPALRVKAALERLRGGPVRELDPDRRRQWESETARRFALDAAHAAELSARRWNYFLFEDRYVSVHPVRADEEIREAYGDRRYRPVGGATIEATVLDARDSLFLPAVYRLTDVAFKEGGPFPVEELVSFEGLYGQIAEAGDRILASGQVEEEAGGACRLVVGSAAAREAGFVRVRRRARG